MTTLIKALNKIEGLFVQLGADKKEAEEAVELFSEVYEDKLATKEFVRKELADAKSDIIKWVVALLIAQAAAIVALQNLVS